MAKVIRFAVPIRLRCGAKDLEQAKDIWREIQAGLGYSHTSSNGEYFEVNGQDLCSWKDFKAAFLKAKEAQRGS